MKVNKFHRAILTEYCNGAYAHLATLEEIDDLQQINDPILVFMLKELDWATDHRDAYNRMIRGRDDLDVAIMALLKVQDAILRKLTTTELA